MPRYALLFCSLVLTSGCDLFDVLDDEPPNALVQENVVTDARSAELLTAGIYSVYGERANNLNYRFEALPALAGGYANGLSFLDPIADLSPDLLPENVELVGLWEGLYKVAAASNNVTDLVGQLEDSDGFAGERRTELIAEARFLRAMAHFDVLRFFGYRYDLDSPYGAILRDEPSDFTNRVQARASVRETYDFILADLNFAIANGPTFDTTFRASRSAARALRARVLLYMGRYDEAAAEAARVIDQAPRSLDPSFADLFDRGLQAQGVLLMRYTDEQTSADDFKRFFYGLGRVTPNDQVRSALGGDPRADVTYSATRILKVNREDTFRPSYFLRLAEQYLIRAEALARTGDLDGARSALNVVRARASTDDLPVPPSTATTQSALLDEIHDEIVRELVYEGGHEWMAAIRFDRLDDLRPTLAREQYVFPIPFSAELIDNTDAEQNPGYLE